MKARKSASKSPTPAKQLFTLRNIRPASIFQKFKVEFPFFGPLEKFGVKQISELQEHPTTISFVDEAKVQRTCVLSSVNISDRTKSYHCFWCRHPFDSQPIGIPISYTPKKATRTYESQISKDKYKITEDVSRDRISQVMDAMQKNSPSDTISVNIYDSYKTDGVVCSWNCMAAFIDTHKNIPLYYESPTLLYKLYRDIMEQDPPESILPAPDWRLLIPYGGHLDIATYRQGFNFISYEFLGVLKTYCHPVAYLFDKQLKI